MRRSHSLVLFAAIGFAALAAPMFAQGAPDAPDRAAAGFASAARSSCGLVVDTDGRLLGLGDRYLAEFGATGMRFTPALGSRAAHDMPLSFELAAVGRDGSLRSAAALALELQANVGGTASFVFALPCDPAVVNFQLESQWIRFGTAFSPCPLLGGVSASNRLLFTLTN